MVGVIITITVLILLILMPASVNDLAERRKLEWWRYRGEKLEIKANYRLGAKPAKRLSFNEWVDKFPKPDPSKINLN